MYKINVSGGKYTFFLVSYIERNVEYGGSMMTFKANKIIQKYYRNIFQRVNSTLGLQCRQIIKDI